MMGLAAALRKRFPESGFAHQVSVLAGGTILGQLLVVMSTPIITRLYSPADMGQLGIFISFLSVAGLAVTLRFELAIPAAEDESTAAALLRISLLLSMPVSVCGAVVLLLLNRYDAMSFGLLPPWISFAAFPALFSIGVFTAIRYWLVRNKQFSGISQVMIVQGLGRSIVPIVLGLIKMNTVGLLAGEVVGRSLGVTEMARGSWPSIKVCFQVWDRKLLLATARRFWKFPAIVLPSSIIDVTALALPVPMIAHYYGSVAAGLFLLVHRLTFLPASLVSASIADVFHSRVVDSVQAGPDAVHFLLLTTMKKLAAYGFVVLLPIGIISPMVFGLIFGGKWSEAGIMVSIIAPWAFASLVISPVSRILVVVHRNEWKLVYDVLALSFVAIGIAGAHAFQFSFNQALLLTSGLQVVSFFVYFIILSRAAANPGSIPTVMEVI